MNAVSNAVFRLRLRQWAKDLLLLAAILLVVIYPSPAYKAALRGMELFLFTVAPGLIPFLILCPLFLKTKLFQRIAKGFSRISRGLFRCDGAVGPLFLMGCLSGFPAGARFVRDALASGQISHEDADRAICFCNVCGPLFMLGAVGVGMFGSPAYGWVLLISHYAAAIVTGVIMARVPTKKKSPSPVITYTAEQSRHPSSLLSSLGLSVQNAMQTMLLVGGYIILGSVAGALADACGIWDGLYALIRPAASAIGLTSDLFKGTASGFIEISGGCVGIAGADSVVWVQLALCSLVIGFSGCAIIGQVTALWEGYDLPLGRYLWARFLHAGTAALLSIAGALLLPVSRMTSVAPSPRPAHVGFDGASYILLCVLLVGFIYISCKKKTR